MRVITPEGDGERFGDDANASQPILTEDAEFRAKDSQFLTAQPAEQRSGLLGHASEKDLAQNPRTNDLCDRGPSDVDHLASKIKLTITLNLMTEQSSSDTQRSPNIQHSPGTPCQSDWWRVPKPSTDFTAQWKSAPDPGPSRRVPLPQPLSGDQEIEGTSPPEKLNTVYARHSVSRNLVRLDKVFTSRDYKVSCLSLASLKNLGIPYVHERMERIPNPRGGFFQPLGYAPLSLYLPCARLFCVEVSVLPESPLPEVGELILGGSDLSRILEGERILGQSLRS